MSEFVLFTILFLATALYLFIEHLNSEYLRKSTQIQEQDDQRSLQRIELSILLAFTLGFATFFIPFGRYDAISLKVLGFILIITGLILRISSILKLKKRFTYRLSLIKDHELEINGVYKLVRHPGYLGQLMVLIGIAFEIGNWLAVLIIPVILIPSYIHRIRIEEQFLISKFGIHYTDYMKSTKRLIPFIY